MIIANQLSRLLLVAAALALAVTPLANPLLLALALLGAGLLLAYRCAADLLGAGMQPAEGDTVFRHYL